MIVLGFGFGSSQFYVKSSSLVLISSFLGLGQFFWVGTHAIQGSSYRLGAFYSLIGPLTSWLVLGLAFDIGWG